LERTITSTVEAVSYLGIERTKALSLVTHSFGQFGALKMEGFSIEKLWQHSVVVGTVAQRLTKEETGENRRAEEAFTAGVLHDVGKLMVAVNLPEQFQRVAERQADRGVPFHEAELALLGASHAEIGACVMGSWGLPASIVEAIAFHHAPDQYFDKQFNAAVAVHVANALEHARETPPAPGTSMAPESEGADVLPFCQHEYLEALGLGDRISRWRELAEEARAA
jgi:putative nucleotidyltransferase with HDIG domain